MATSEKELAQLAVTFLHRVDLKGIEARRMVEVQQWLDTIIATAEARPALRVVEADPNG